jgi:death-on-curing protein
MTGVLGGRTVTREEGEAEPRWVPRDAVEVVHTDLVRTLGGQLGIRDSGFLDVALAKAANRWADDRSVDLSDLAAAYGSGIANSRAFVDHNNRTALMVMVMFLRLNGLRLVADEHDAVVAMLGVANGGSGEPDLAAWVRAHVAPVVRSKTSRRSKAHKR